MGKVKLHWWILLGILVGAVVGTAVVGAAVVAGAALTGGNASSTSVAGRT